MRRSARARSRLLLYLSLLTLGFSASLLGCKSKDSHETSQSRTDSTTIAAQNASLDSLRQTVYNGHATGGDELQLPSVPQVGGARESQPTRKLPEDDEMDVRSPIQIKYVASAETSVRGLRFYVVGVETNDKMTIIHGFVQNLWGMRTRMHPQPIAVRIFEADMSGAKLLDDQTGKSHVIEPKLAPSTIEVTKSADWNLAPGDRQMMTLIFPPVPNTSRTATLIIPGFATVTGVPLS